MNFWDWFPILLWPVTLLYGLLCVLVISLTVKGSVSRQGLTAFLILPALPLLKFLIVDASQSLVHLFNFYFAFVVAGALCCIAFLFAYFSRLPDANRAGGLILFALAGPALLFFGSNVLIQDHVRKRAVIEGTVSQLNAQTWSRKASEYRVVIGTKRVWATQEIFEALNVGDRVRAEVGKGSIHIYKIERNPAAG